MTAVASGEAAYRAQVVVDEVVIASAPASGATGAAAAEHLGSNASLVGVITNKLSIDLRCLWRAFSAVGADFDDAKHLDVPVYYVRRRLRGDEARFVLRYDS